MRQEPDPFASPPPDAPRRSEPPGFNPWLWARRHVALALLVVLTAAAVGYMITAGVYLYLTDPN